MNREDSLGPVDPVNPAVHIFHPVAFGVVRDVLAPLETTGDDLSDLSGAFMDAALLL